MWLVSLLMVNAEADDAPEIRKADPPSMELLLHLAQWETDNGEFLDPMLLDDEQTEEDKTANDGSTEDKDDE